MLWVLKRTVSMRRFFRAPKHMFKLIDKKIIAILRKLFLLNLPYVKLNKSYAYCVLFRANNNELRHEISNNVVCATSKASDQPAHMGSLI